MAGVVETSNGIGETVFVDAWQIEAVGLMAEDPNSEDTVAFGTSVSDGHAELFVKREALIEKLVSHPLSPQTRCWARSHPR